jgi:hypothetical protein
MKTCGNYDAYGCKVKKHGFETISSKLFVFNVEWPVLPWHYRSVADLHQKNADAYADPGKNLDPDPDADKFPY